MGLVQLRAPVDKIKYPRAAIARFPRGATVGEPNNSAQQRQVLEDALAVLATATQPGVVVELKHAWAPPAV